MSLEQVRAAAPTPLEADFSTTYNTRTGGFSFEFGLKFDFIEPFGLAVVTLTPKTFDWCGDVREQLGLTYGTAVQLDVWLDTYNGNLIEFIEIGTTECRVEYSVRNKANSPGAF